MASPIGYRLAGIAPETDPVYALRPQARKAFWREAAVVGLKVKKRSLARGLDKDGNRMAPVSLLTRQARRANVNPVRGERPYSSRGTANPYAPPLQATGTNSRTYALLRFEIRGESVWYYWGLDSDTGLDWGIVLARHAGGFWQRFVYPRPSFGFVKPRDVIGLSNQDLRDIAQEMGRWWLANRGRFAGRDMPNTGTPGRVVVPQRPTSELRPTMETGRLKVTPAQPADRTRTLPADQFLQFTTPSKRNPFGPRPPRVPIAPPQPPRPPAMPAAVMPPPPMPPSPVLVGAGGNRRIGAPWLKWLLVAIGLGALAGVATRAASKEEE